MLAGAGTYNTGFCGQVVGKKIPINNPVWKKWEKKAILLEVVRWLSLSEIAWRTYAWVDKHKLVLGHPVKAACVRVYSACEECIAVSYPVMGWAFWASRHPAEQEQGQCYRKGVANLTVTHHQRTLCIPDGSESLLSACGRSGSDRLMTNFIRLNLMPNPLSAESLSWGAATPLSNRSHPDKQSGREWRIAVCESHSAGNHTSKIKQKINTIKPTVTEH